MITLFLLRKPFNGSNLVRTIEQYGTGSIMVDELRIPINTGENLARMNVVKSWKNVSVGPNRAVTDPSAASGRWPSNFTISEKVRAYLDTIQTKSGTSTGQKTFKMSSSNGVNRTSYADEGSVARFFYLIEE
jgi:hypothetical protein